MEDKIKETVNNVCTILGGALLLYPLIEQATKTIAPEIEKLTSGEYEKQIPLLGDGKEDKKDDSDSDRKKELETANNEISELKKRLAELESKEKSEDS